MPVYTMLPVLEYKGQLLWESYWSRTILIMDMMQLKPGEFVHMVKAEIIGPFKVISTTLVDAASSRL